jgi:putative heme degradation protein
LEVHREDVEVEINMPREQWFVLKAKKPGISARSLANKFDIEELVDYQNRSSVEINNKR